MCLYPFDFEAAENTLYDIAVLAGGDSAEREVSLASGRRVAAALQEFGHQVALFDPEDTSLFDINWNEFDVCFIALHGGAGEDGRIQVQLEEVCVPYTGSGPAASRLALSKAAAKDRLQQCGVVTPPSFSFHKTQRLGQIRTRLEQLGFPLIVKPDGQGCSLGVHLVDTADNLAASVEAAGRLEAYLLAEKRVVGREFTVAVIDREPLPALEIVHQRPTFDFEVKFGAAPADYQFPQDEAAQRAERTAVAAAKAIGTRGLCRVDLICDRTGQTWVLEVNTVPGMTAHSLAPLAAAQAGFSMPQLCDRLTRLCLLQTVMA